MVRGLLEKALCPQILDDLTSTEAAVITNCSRRQLQYCRDNDTNLSPATNN